MFATLQASLLALSLSLSLFSQALEPTVYVREPVFAYNEFNSESRDMSPMGVKILIIEYFPDNWQTMYEIAKCESNLKGIQSEAVYLKDRPKWGVKANEPEKSYGIYQIHDPLGKYNKWRLLNDPEYNIKIAKQIYDEQSYGAWYNCGQRENIRKLIQDNKLL